MKSILQLLLGRRASPPVDPAALAAAATQLIADGTRAEDAGDIARARDLYEQAVARAPALAIAHFHLGNAMAALQIPREAMRCYERAIELRPDYAEAHFNLATVLLMRDSLLQAETHYREAIDARADWTDAWAALGCVLEMRGAEEEAIAAFEHALQLAPGHAGAATRLAGLHKAAGRVSAALRILDAALVDNAEPAILLRTRAEILASVGDYDLAVADYRRVIATAPEDIAAWSGMLWTLNFRPESTAQEILAAHEEFGGMMGRMCPPRPVRLPHATHARLKVGYVSADFCRHPVSCFIEPLLRHHDRDAVEVHCFYNHHEVDEVTERLRARADHWHDIAGLSDEEVADRIEANGIDVLVDLAGHTTHNRLRLFALKPAPVQFTWLGYLCTTGLKTIDYRICDSHTDPPGVAEQWQVEKPVRLPASQWCYQAQVGVPATGPLPMLANGYPTFGSFNQESKLSALTLDVWAAILVAIAGSRLRIVGVASDIVGERIHRRFADSGIAAERVELLGRVPIESYFDCFRDVDIALDSLPYNGATTTCDALIMGVPVATLAGQRAIARGGVSLLTSVGLDDWIAPTANAMVEMLRARCADPESLSGLRARLPARMRASALMDAARFARNLEEIFVRASRG